MKQVERIFKPSISQVEDVNAMSSPGYIPSQIKRAYNFPCSCTGQGKTIAIVDAYGNPNIIEELTKFNERFNLPPADLEIIYPQGPPDEGDPEWAIETSLDVEWMHALAPNAKLLLIIAKDASFEYIYDAIRYAATSGADVVSMSFGAEELEEQTMYDEIFKQPGVVFVSSTGDFNDISYPSTSPYVVAVGATSLRLNSCGNRCAEEIVNWNSGGGISQFEQKPPWQNICSEAVPKTDMRTVPDLCFFGDSFPGVVIYTIVDGTPYWVPVGGTSFSTVGVAAILALAIPEGTKLYNAPELLYALAGGCCYTNPYRAYNDVETGNNQFYFALPGYDYVAGLGSPKVSEFIRSVRRYA